MALGKLTDRVVSLESRIVHSRTEVHDEFSAIRNDMTTRVCGRSEQGRRLPVEMVTSLPPFGARPLPSGSKWWRSLRPFGEAAAFRTEVAAEEPPRRSA
jgi:hypothetical protein